MTALAAAIAPHAAGGVTRTQQAAAPRPAAAFARAAGSAAAARRGRRQRLHIAAAAAAEVAEVRAGRVLGQVWQQALALHRNMHGGPRLAAQGPTRRRPALAPPTTSRRRTS